MMQLRLFSPNEELEDISRLVDMCRDRVLLLSLKHVLMFFPIPRWPTLPHVGFDKIYVEFGSCACCKALVKPVVMGPCHARG